MTLKNHVACACVSAEIEPLIHILRKQGELSATTGAEFRCPVGLWVLIASSSRMTGPSSASFPVPNKLTYISSHLSASYLWTQAEETPFALPSPFPGLAGLQGPEVVACGLSLDQ